MTGLRQLSAEGYPMNVSRSTLYGVGTVFGAALWFVGVPLGTVLTFAPVGIFLTMHMGGHGGCGDHGGAAHASHSAPDRSVDQARHE